MCFFAHTRNFMLGNFSPCFFLVISGCSLYDADHSFDSNGWQDKMLNWVFDNCRFLKLEGTWIVFLMPVVMGNKALVFLLQNLLWFLLSGWYNTCYGAKVIFSARKTWKINWMTLIATYLHGHLAMKRKGPSVDVLAFWVLDWWEKHCPKHTASKHGPSRPIPNSSQELQELKYISTYPATISVDLSLMTLMN